MNEKIIAKAEFKDVKFACMTLPVIMFLIYCINSYRASYQSWKDDYNFSYGFGFGNGANLILIPLIFLSI
ncbi:MAG: hypothetical protein J6A26_07385, partial [Oscillospiraceae bacterium]|nr:hypothetical protein [Oscillospiraceae bacterium]